MKKAQLRVIGVIGFSALTLAMVMTRVRSDSPSQLNGYQPAVEGQEQSFDQNKKIAELAKQISGKEDKPAGEVFKNVQMLKAVPAGRLLKIMELGYSKSLGVNCAHCHVVDQWDKDDKPTKQITREMIKMAAAINNDYLKNIKNLKSPNPIVNCTTCHRGQTKPALNMP